MAVLNYLLGTVRVELRCKYSERAVNICAVNHVDFRDLVRGKDGAAEMTVGLSGYVTLRRVAKETGAFTVRLIRRRGAPFFLWRIRKRYVLLTGMAVCLMLIGLSTVYVWQIDVLGNVTVPTSEILAALRSEGVDIGTCVLDIPARQVENDMLLRVPKLSFITLNNHGSRLEVIVREEREKPELFDPDVPTAVRAKKGGIVVSVTAREGWTLVKPGDTVAAGDELISAYVPLGTGRTVHATGSVRARTWYELTASMPLQAVKKEYTGEKTVRRAIILGGKRINLYISGGNPYASCDKIISYTDTVLPGGAVMPLSIVREEYEEYNEYPYTVSAADAERMLRSELLYELERELGDGAVVTADYDVISDEKLVTVTLRAECMEEIGTEHALSERELSELSANNKIETE